MKLKWLWKIIVTFVRNRLINGLLRDLLKKRSGTLLWMMDQAYAAGEFVSVQGNKLAKKLGIPNAHEKHVEPGLKKVIERFLLGMEEHKPNG